MGGHPEYSLFHCTQDILNIFGTGTNTGIDPPPPGIHWLPGYFVHTAPEYKFGMHE